ncbi:MAG TPA: winged helix-turn-helix domain-containing protein [Labilithrix sp.]|nr:winged helix-turn-helix domain-containing protein [Labilithrix sp.]
MPSVRRTNKSLESFPSVPPWTFLTNHAHVLICIAEEPTARIRDLAERVGITERAVQKIITELEEANYLTHVREGRRNVYRVKANLPLRHPVEKHHSVAALLELVGRGAKR